MFDNVDAALSVARRRLDSLRRDPVKHARHAIKVLMKFKLLEVQSISIVDWEAWLRGTAYLAAIRKRFFGDVELDRLTEDILGELIAAGAARM
ncbi:hypothetical protein FHT32_006868, partial [Variovorax sp. SG517]|nr:hypothetical protein [Variovorax sp. SG517]